MASASEEFEWSLRELIEATGGTLSSGVSSFEKRYKRIVTDSRQVEEGDIFVALRGERFDGHDFVRQTLENGAKCLIIAKRPDGLKDAGNVDIIHVKDTVKALGDLGRYRRKAFKGPVIGITGSNGKTSTKEMVATVLSNRFKVLKNPMNWNNNVGLPLSLFNLRKDHTIMVLEMGINHPEEMDELLYISQPTVGIITNIHKAHLEGLGSEEVICREKTKMWQALPIEEGLAIVNNDDPYLREAYIRHFSHVKAITYGIRTKSDVTALEDSVAHNRKTTSFEVSWKGHKVRIELPVLGRHFIYNALAAIAVATHLNIPLEEIPQSFSTWKPVSHRMEQHVLNDGTVIVDDTYNANPGSMVASIETVASMAEKEGRPFIAIVGDMKELGESAPELHRHVGRALVKYTPAMVITLGSLGAYMAEEVRKNNIDMVFSESNHESVLEMIFEHWIPGAWILIKGSRSMRMEKIVEGLLADGET